MAADDRAMSFAQMMEGPKHTPHIRQVQIGWLGQTGAFYAWPTVPTAEQEPGSYIPVFIDEHGGPDLGDAVKPWWTAIDAAVREHPDWPHGDEYVYDDVLTFVERCLLRDRHASTTR